jgi:peptidoglycan/LPS O-acetylase OafA/YrhL
MKFDSAATLGEAKAESPATVDAIPYRADIDGLRGIAVIAVMLFHTWPSFLRGGFIGVDVFFVISGYLISGIIFSALDSPSGFSFTNFYFRRARRLFPALLVVLTFSICLGWFVLLPKQYSQLGSDIAAASAFIANFSFFRGAGYFAAGAETKPLLHLWSLGVEEQFYILWPSLLILISKFHRFTAIVIALLAIASFISNIESSFTNQSAAFFLPQNRFWELLVGALIALSMRGGRNLPSPKLADTASAVAIILFAVAIFKISQNRIFPGWWALLPVASSALFILAGPNAIFNRWILSFPRIVWIGLISYPLYLWHWILLSFVRIVYIGPPNFFARLGCVALAIVLAWATFQYVERPIRFKMSKSLWAVPLFAALAVIGAAGILLNANGGFSSRTIYGWGEQRQFVQFYRDIIENLTEWRYECNFFDWRNNKSKNYISPSCTAIGKRPIVFLWGDSHAQALSPGIREALGNNASFNQIATSGCYPNLADVTQSPDVKSCNLSNWAARDFIQAARPDILILAQRFQHEMIDWKRISDFALESGVKKIILIGPTPQWKADLPEIIAHHFWNVDHTYIQRGIDPSAFQTDAVLHQKYDNSNFLTYVSLIDKLCSLKGCRTTVPGKENNNLIIFDYGHLTPAGSSFVGREILKPILLKAIE